MKGGHAASYQRVFGDKEERSAAENRPVGGVKRRSLPQQAGRPPGKVGQKASPKKPYHERPTKLKFEHDYASDDVAHIQSLIDDELGNNNRE